MGSCVWKDFLSLLKNPASNVLLVKLLNRNRCVYAAHDHGKHCFSIQWAIVSGLRTHPFELARNITSQNVFACVFVFTHCESVVCTNRMFLNLSLVFKALRDKSTQSWQEPFKRQTTFYNSRVLSYRVIELLWCVLLRRRGCLGLPLLTVTVLEGKCVIKSQIPTQ